MKRILTVVVLVGLVLILSDLSTRIWGGKDEHGGGEKKWVLQMDMTVAQFGKANGLPNPMLKKAFELQSKQDLQKPLSAFGLTEEQVRAKASKFSALAAEHGSKNWQKILIKFGLWFVWLAAILAGLRKGLVTEKNRSWLLLVAVVLFGVILGSDPSPMGTVKDAIVLYARDRAVFPPRMIAFGVFMLLVILANKLICSWGCQLGTLQDLLFRIMQRKTGTAVIKPAKLTFAVTNTIRIFFLAVFTGVVFKMGFDIIGTIDPFKIFNPKMLGWSGGIFVAVVLIASCIVYRPWCHLFCPFGLVGWLGEKISVFRIRIDRDTCTDCKACVKACPSNVMDSYLEKKAPAPDCFACGACIETCPVKAISFAAKTPTGTGPSDVTE
ncbi:MAG: 4Fe-4S dicluster domain-containing protein [Planctomycetota bacterium]